MLLHPFQSLPLIQQTSIEISVLADLLAGQKTKGPDTVVEIDEDDTIIGPVHDLGTVEVCILITCVAASLDKEPHG